MESTDTRQDSLSVASAAWRSAASTVPTPRAGYVKPPCDARVRSAKRMICAWLGSGSEADPEVLGERDRALTRHGIVEHDQGESIFFLVRVPIVLPGEDLQLAPRGLPEEGPDVFCSRWRAS